jgi:hypothetical protein
MKHFKLFEEFSELSEDLNPIARKDLDKLGAGFEKDEEIVDAITRVGFRKLPPKGSGEYVFLDPPRSTKYVSSTAGYVRYIDPTATYWLTGEPITTKTPVHKGSIESTRDRLLIILRRAMKLNDIYKDWKKSGLNGKDFLEKASTQLTAKKFGV